MNIVESVIMGILQGITEWLPISSSGQGMLVMVNLLNLSPTHAFTFAIYLHLGTLLAVLVKFRKRVWEVVMEFTRGNISPSSLPGFIIISTIFTGFSGIPVYISLKHSFSAWSGDAVTIFIGLMLIVTGLVLRYSKKIKGRRSLSELVGKDGIIAGIAQGFTILPGISRSGTTVAVLLFRGLSGETALILSFLMSIPAISGAFVLEIFSQGVKEFEILSVVAGILASFITGYLMINLLLSLSKKLRFDMFCILFGLIALSNIIWF